MKTLMISNAIILAVFVGKQVIEYIFSFFKRKAEKDESKVDDMSESIIELKIQIASLKTQIEMMMKGLYAIEKVEKDINALFKKLRNVKDFEG